MMGRVGRLAVQPIGTLEPFPSRRVLRCLAVDDALDKRPQLAASIAARPGPYRPQHISDLWGRDPVDRHLVERRSVYPQQSAVARLLLRRPFGCVVFEVGISDLAERLASGLCRPNAERLCGDAAAERNGEILARSPGLRWRHVRGRAETFAADH